MGIKAKRQRKGKQKDRGKGRGRRSMFVLAPARFSFFLEWGAALAAPVSFHSEWRQCVLPPFLFILKGAALTSISFYFKWRQHVFHMLPLFLSILNQRQHEFYMLALFLLLYPPMIEVFHFLLPLPYSN